MASNRLRENREEKIVILDCSAVMMPFEFSIELEEELTRLLGKYRIIMLTPILRELEYLSKHGKGKKKSIAKASLKLAENYDTMDVDEEQGDNAIFYMAKKLKAIVVTNDKELKKRLQKIAIPVIYLREKQKLMLE